MRQSEINRILGKVDDMALAEEQVNIPFVLALNCLQNSIILTPFAPSAGPTGGAGLAAPPLICNLISAEISFAI